MRRVAHRDFAPVTAVEHERRAWRESSLADVRRLDRDLTINRKRVRRAVAASGTRCHRSSGISDVLTAKILGPPGNITPLRNRGTTPSYTGTADRSLSGDIRRHRCVDSGIAR